MTAMLEMGRRMAALFERLRPATLRAAKAITDVYVTAGGAVLATEAAMDLQLRDEVGLDVAWLEVFDDEPRP